MLPEFKRHNKPHRPILLVRLLLWWVSHYGMTFIRQSRIGFSMGSHIHLLDGLKTFFFTGSVTLRAPLKSLQRQALYKCPYIR